MPLGSTAQLKPQTRETPLAEPLIADGYLPIHGIERTHRYSMRGSRNTQPTEPQERPRYRHLPPTLMKQIQQRSLDALLRVQAFLDANATTVGPIGTSAARRELDDAITALNDHATTQGSATRTIAGQKNTQRSLEVSIRNEHMKPIATFARARLRGTPNFAALTRKVDNLNGPKLVYTARAMATAAAPYADTFAASGMPADSPRELADAADELQGVITARASSKVSRVTSTKAMQEQLVAGKEAVTILHAIITKQFGKDATFLAGWNRARRIQEKPGTPRKPKDVTASDVAPAPVATGAATTASPAATAQPIAG